jgi:hypothetical protein
MSLESQADLQCPECGHSQSVTVWRSINADLDPAARSALLSGQINVFHCKRCQHQAQFPVALLYHDMTRQFLVQYYPFDALDDLTFLEEFNQQGESNAPAGMSQMLAARGIDYASRVHVVFQMTELVRYVVFREHLFAYCQSKREDVGPA